MRKRVSVMASGAIIAVVMAVAVFGGGTAYAHKGGHPGGCAGFGEIVSGVLAGPGFGQFLSELAPSAPNAVSDMVDAQGHSFCN